MDDAMESPAAEYPESPMDAYTCKGCGDVLDEGKAFELANNRWHLDCFRCNSCHTLLDSDANLLLLGDGSLICNNCTYSCSACGNKIEDLAILTGDQAFCATCFRCRNCKRKIENLRYARTSQGIFCMSCHESLMARRRKKSKAAAAAAKAKEKETMLVDKSLPALPPNVIPQSALDAPRQSSDSGLSPPPRPQYAQHNESPSSPRRGESPERPSDDVALRDGLTLPTTTYKNNRHSTISQASDLGGNDGEGFFIPLAFDPSPAPSVTPRIAASSATLPRGDQSQNMKENGTTRDYFTSKRKVSNNETPQSQASTPHIAFQEKHRTASSEHMDGTRDPPRRPLVSSSRSDSANASPALGFDDSRRQAQPPPNGVAKEKPQTQEEKFQLQDVPKRKKSPESRLEAEGERRDPPPRSPSREPRPPPQPPRPTQTEPPHRFHDRSVSSPYLLGDQVSSPRRSQGDSRSREEPPPRPSEDSSASNYSTSTRELPPRLESLNSSSSILRKEVGGSSHKQSMSSSVHDQKPPTFKLTENGDSPHTVNGKPISGPILQETPINDDSSNRQNHRPPPPQPKVSDSYMAPRAPPPPPVMSGHTSKPSVSSVHGVSGEPASPKLPRWSAGGELNMDEDMARILGADERSESILRRVSNAVRHGRTGSEASGTGPRQGHYRSVSEVTNRTAQSPSWPKTPIIEDDNFHGPRGISSPMSVAPPRADDPALLRRQLRNSEQRVAELEKQVNSSVDLKHVSQRLEEKRKTVTELDSQAELMVREIEVLAGYVETAKSTKGPIDFKHLEESFVKDFVSKIERLKQNMSREIESLFEEKETLLEERDNAVKARDRALVEFEQLSSKNAQLADLNNDLTTQIQERFRGFKDQDLDRHSPKPQNGLGIYTNHTKDKGSMNLLDDASLVSGMTGYSSNLSGSTFPVGIEHHHDGQVPTTVLTGPHVVNIRKGQAKKFNWKKGGTAVKNVSKGFKGAFSSEKDKLMPLNGDSIGMPYNMTTEGSSPHHMHQNSLPRSASNDPRSFGLWKKSHTVPKTQSSGDLSRITAENPATLFGSELVDRAEYERRHIPHVVIRCIEEVEVRGMEIEGIYRKTGGSGLVKMIQEGFEKSEDYDISDPDLDITAVTSVLKQYFRKLPTPLLTFDIYDRVLAALSVEDTSARCAHLRYTFNSLPQVHRDVLEFLIFHLARVVARAELNLMTPKNIAVVFAPTIMRDLSLEREMTDMQARNDVVQFVVEHSNEIFSDS